MKIAFLITSTGWGGLEMNTTKLAKSLGALGFEITLITQEDATLLKNEKSLFNSTLLIKKNRKYFDFKTAKKIAIELAEKKIDTVFVVDNKDLDVITWTKTRHLKNLKIVYQQHMQIGIPKKDWLHTFRFNKIDKWISPLKYLIEEIKIQTKFDPSKIVQIPIGVDTKQLFAEKTDRESARNYFNLTPDDYVIGIIGRISRKKGQLFVVQALKEELKNNLNSKLLIFGSATVNDLDCQKYEKELHDFVKKEHLEGSVIFHPHSSKTSSFYKSIDLFVLGSESETYGMVTLEALLFQLPVLATKSGGTTDLLQNGDFGNLYEFGNTEDFLKKYKYIVCNPLETNTKANDGYNFALENYTLENETNAINTLLQHL